MLLANIIQRKPLTFHTFEIHITLAWEEIAKSSNKQCAHFRDPVSTYLLHPILQGWTLEPCSVQVVYLFISSFAYFWLCTCSLWFECVFILLLKRKLCQSFPKSGKKSSLTLYNLLPRSCAGLQIADLYPFN